MRAYFNGLGLRSNISVGLPLDLLIYEADSLAVSRFVTIDEKNQHFQLIRKTWGQQLRNVFESISAPVWNAPPDADANALSSANTGSQPIRVPPPHNLRSADLHPEPMQPLAQGNDGDEQH